MKKAILACAAALATLCVMVPAHADDHHHPVCHKVHQVARDAPAFRPVRQSTRVMIEYCINTQCCDN
jgi:hypothetical protein